MTNSIRPSTTSTFNKFSMSNVLPVQPHTNTSTDASPAQQTLTNDIYTPTQSSINRAKEQKAIAKILFATAVLAAYAGTLLYITKSLRIKNTQLQPPPKMPQDVLPFPKNNIPPQPPPSPKPPSPQFPWSQPQNRTTNDFDDLWTDIDSALKIDEMSLPEALKKLLGKIVKNIKNPKAIEARGGKGIKSILLYGPPGTGKTTFAKAIAKEFPDSKFASLDVTKLSSKYVGETEKNLQERVEEICRRANAHPDKKFFVFVDEIDSIMLVDHSNSKKYSNDVLNEFKRCFSEKLGKQNNIVTIGATNIPIDPKVGQTLDGKMLDRPMLDRFQEKVLVDRPTAGQLRDAIVHHYKNASLVSDELKSPDSEKLQILCKFLAKKERETSFRTLNSIYNIAATEGDVTSKLTIKDLIEVLKNKQEELHITNLELENLIKAIGD